MAKLTMTMRKHMPNKQFGMPGSRKYPMPDKSHAANAKARAAQQVKAGNLSKASEDKIDAMADRMLGSKESPKEERGDAADRRLYQKSAARRRAGR
jgi:hypothetical protein